MHSRTGWRRIRFDWNHARAFLMAAREGSLSAAARATGSTQSTIGRQITALEHELGAILFQRIGPTMTLTDCGHALLEHVSAMAEAAGQATLSLDIRSQLVEGTIAIAASEVYCASVLPPIIARLRTLYPGINVEIVSDNNRTDLLRREADIAIRNYVSPSSGLVTQQIGNSIVGLYATPDFIGRAGDFESRTDFSEIAFVGFPSNKLLINQLAGIGMNLGEENFVVQSDSLLVQWEMVKSGAGVGVMSTFLGDAEPAVTRIPYTPNSLIYPRWIATHRELYTSKKLRTVFDFLVAELR